MADINDAAPLLRGSGSASLDQGALHWRCKMSHNKTSLSAHNSTDPLPEDGPSTCYLQDGGGSASGKRVTRKLILACGLSFTFMLFEIVGGYFADSVAIMSDAAHMFSDVLAFVVSVYCMRLIERRAEASYTFGYHRAETIGALISVLIVCLITGGLVVEAVQRLANPEHINGKLMFIVATLGIAFNVLLLFTLGHDHHVHLGGSSCSHDHGHGHGHSHAPESVSASAPSHSLGHGHRKGPPAELSTVRVSSAGSEEATTAAEVESTGQGATAANGHSHCWNRDHDHAHDHGTHSHDHGHDHSHGPSCGHERSESSHSQDHQPLMQRRGKSCGHSHDHSHHGACGHHHDDHGHDHENQNLRGAIVHVMGDIFQSIGVAAAGAIIWYTDGDPKWLWVDPACTFIFAISVVWVTKTLIVDVTKDLMEAAPSNIDVEALLAKMKCVTGVCGVHDLHVWRIGTGKIMLTAHVDVTNKSSSDQVTQDLEDMVHRAGVSHSTVQLCNVSPE